MKGSKRSVLIIFTAFLVLSLASIDCTIEAKEKVTIYRDNYGVPHIYARTAKALWTAFGYVVAKDRLWHLEVLRASLWGKVAELYGPGAGNKYIDFDIATRPNLFSAEEIARELKSVGKEYQIMLESYANGINMYIKEALANPGEKLPFEFHKNGIMTIEPWTAVDVAQMYIGSLGIRFSDSSNELSNAALLDYLTGKYGATEAVKIFNDILPLHVTDSPVTIPPDEVKSKMPSRTTPKEIPKAMIASIPKGIKEVVEKERIKDELIASVLNDLGLSSYSGSYMWVVGGEKTDGKTTMLLNGPQMAFYVPAYHHEVGLHGAGFDIVGTAPVGYPAILFGHNKNITFGATAAGGNTTDIFILKLARDQYHYVHNGQVLDMQKRTETIKVRGGPPVTVDVYRSIYGPVFQWGDGFAVTKERAWEGKAVESLIGWIDCTKAHNFSQFAEGLTKCAMPANRTYADKMGNIGYIHNGRFPIRHPEVDTRLPTPGTGEYDWQGYHPFSWNPKILNPSQGFLANWNNRPSLNYPSGDKIWNSYDRVYRIIKDLKSKKKITFEDMKKINEDIGFIHLTADYFMPYFLNGIGGNLDPQMTEAINRLVSWNRYQVDNNHDGYYDDPGLTIWNQWYAEALKATLQDDLGPNYYRDDSLFLHVLQGDKSDVALSRDYLNGVALSGMLRESLSTALSALKAQFGTDIMSLWLTKTKRHVFQTNNFLGISQGEVKVRDLHQEMNRGTQNHIVVLGRGRVTGVNVNPPGEIGFIHPNGTPSPHYSDQLDIFEDYKGYKPMLHDKDQVLSNLELVEFIVVD